MLAWVGSILLAICGVPELIRTIRDSHCYIGWGMLLMWFFGEAFVCLHVYHKYKDYALLMNYTLNLLIISVMLFYKMRF